MVFSSKVFFKCLITYQVDIKIDFSAIPKIFRVLILNKKASLVKP